MTDHELLGAGALAAAEIQGGAGDLEKSPDRETVIVYLNEAVVIPAENGSSSVY
ncbi:MAG: hypothetical protein V4555_04005 [Acidobacteriota bacterium]